MRAPIGHLAAAELIPPAEIPMMIVAIERNLRCLAEVIVPVQPSRNRLFREWPFHWPRRQADDDMLKLSDAPVADQFASQAEIPIAALLAPNLENAFVVAHGFHQPFALVDRERQRFFGVYVF